MNEQSQAETTDQIQDPARPSSPHGLRIVLLGPPNAGKTSLLASCRYSQTYRCHSYPVTSKPSITPGNKHQTTDQRNPLTLLMNLEGEFEQLERAYQRLWDRQEHQPVTDKTKHYPLTVAIEDPKSGDMADHDCVVIDTGGELLTMVGGDPKRRSPDEIKTYQKLLDELSDCTAVVLVFSFGSGPDAGRWEPFMFDLMHAFARLETVRIERIVLAFTCYETLFVDRGNKAAFYAGSRSEALSALRNAINTSRGLVGALEKLRDTPIEVYCVPTSFYGFIRHNGCANVAKYVDGGVNTSLLIHLKELHHIAEDEVELRRRWVPFLTCDPFILAATGIPGRWAFPLRELAPYLGMQEDVETNEEVADGPEAPPTSGFMNPEDLVVPPEATDPPRGRRWWSRWR